MTFFLVLTGGIALIGWVIALLDWYSRKKDRESKRAA